ncbi:MAG: LamG domain-containing protein, partial [Planctomycetota bacterium]|nr:LamG domain-containing protein [Planctomycetota bacterium]
ANGNVRAVFAGHIHRMRYDGKRDGIDYYTLAATGGRLEFELPGAGYLHEFHVVTVRPDDITIATLPVGAVIDPQQITGQVSEDVDRLVEKLRPKAIKGLKFRADGGVLGTLSLRLENPVNRPIDVTVGASGDESWTFTPDHTHATLGPKEARTFELHARRRTDLGTPPRLPRLAIDCDYLAENLRLSIPRVERTVQMPAPKGLQEICATAERANAPQRALQLAAPNSCGRIPASAIALPDGPMTVEAWLRGSSFSGKRKIVSKAQDGEFHLSITDGAVSFMLHLDGSYRGATTDPVLKPNGWHHVAGVFDGKEVRIYVDGRLLARNPAEGSRTTNTVALLVGAEPDAKSKPTSGFAGQLAEVRISSTARYADDAFEPPTQHEPDAHCELLLRCQQDAGSWILDSSSHGRHATPVGDARLTLRQ